MKHFFDGIIPKIELCQMRELYQEGNTAVHKYISDNCSWISEVKEFDVCDASGQVHVNMFTKFTSAGGDAQSLEQWGHWKSVEVITADAALWRRSLAAVSFWLRASLKLDAALCIEALHTGLSIARSSNSLGLMWHHWRFAFTVSLYLSLGRPWFRLPSWSSP